MDTKLVLRKSWQIVWRYRALWFLAMILALTAAYLVTIIPLLVIGGWVEISKSSLWTLTYRALSAGEAVVKVVHLQKPLFPAPAAEC